MLTDTDPQVLEALYPEVCDVQAGPSHKVPRQTGMPFPDDPAPDEHDVNTSVHPRVYQILAALFFGIISVFYVVFADQADTVFMIAICGVYFSMYFGTIVALARVSPRRTRTRQAFDRFLRTPFDTFSGQLTGREVLLQICLVPALVLMGCVAIGVIIVLAR